MTVLCRKPCWKWSNKTELGASTTSLPQPYHNRKDLISFPDFGREDAVFQRKTRPASPLKGKSSLIKQVLRKDILLNYPYHDFACRGFDARGGD